MKNWIVSYVLNRDNSSINIITLIAMKEFGEVGIYTEEEVDKVVKLLSQQQVPEMKEIDEFGYKTYSEWDTFVKENNIKIKQLLND